MKPQTSFGEIQKASYDRYVNDYKDYSIVHFCFNYQKEILRKNITDDLEYLSNVPFVTLHLPERHMPDYGH